MPGSSDGLGSRTSREGTDRAMRTPPPRRLPAAASLDALAGASTAPGGLFGQWHRCDRLWAARLRTPDRFDQARDDLPDNDWRSGGHGLRAYDQLFAPGRFEPNLEVVDALRPIAQRLDVSLGQLALAWLLHRDGITGAIAGSRSPEHVRENAAASNVEISAETLARSTPSFRNVPNPSPRYRGNRVTAFEKRLCCFFDRGEGHAGPLRDIEQAVPAVAQIEYPEPYHELRSWSPRAHRWIEAPPTELRFSLRHEIDVEPVVLENVEHLQVQTQGVGEGLRMHEAEVVRRRVVLGVLAMWGPRQRANGEVEPREQYWRSLYP